MLDRPAAFSPASILEARSVMKATDILKQEHKAILQMLEIINAVCERLQAGQSVNPDHLEQIVEFIQDFADRCHHGKEEEFLFKAMEEAGIPRQGGPIGVMMNEHETGRGFVKDMSDAVREYRDGDSKAGLKFADYALNYSELLTSHIHKENNILFSMADRYLSDDVQKKLVEDFEKVEMEKIGKGRHEELHKILDNLKNFYHKEHV